MRVSIPASVVILALLLVLSFDTNLPSAVTSVEPSSPLTPAPAGGMDAVYASLRAYSANRLPKPPAPDPTPEDLTAMVGSYCVVCHNDQMLTAGLSLEGFDVAAAPEHAETAEKVINKLRLGMMPPPGMPRPGGDTLMVLAQTLENQIDLAASRQPQLGDRSFQRLNQAEYTRAVHDLLGVEVEAGAYLPGDTKSDNFDNIADVQLLSPTLLDSYLRAAAEISRIAVGEPKASFREARYNVLRLASQNERVDGAPYGTRGGLSVVHNFPADGEYHFLVSFFLTSHGGLIGESQRHEQLDISVDGERVALLDLDRFISESDPAAVLTTVPIRVKAGPRRISAAFIPITESSHQSLIPFHAYSLASQGQNGRFGVGELMHLRDLVIRGPQNVTGVSETPARQKIFTCRPTAPAEARPCAREIASRLARQAFRRPGPPSAKELDELMELYDLGAAEGGFEEGVRTVLEALLASPEFVFRLEPVPTIASRNGVYPLSGPALASRLSFFLWATLPDEELLNLASQGKLSDPVVLEAQVRRMLADPRSESLATRFAAQWLRLPDLASIEPSTPLYPDFNEQLRTYMRRETELFFYNLVRQDRNVLELWDANYTFVNAALARHYGIPGVSGSQFRRVPVTDEQRRGLLGHASILTLTSHAGRTSATDRGKWVMEVFLNSPPPPPPPGVPVLDATSDVSAGEGRFLTVRERMEMHRSNAACASCHVMIDPIGLALENYDVTGRWRIMDNFVPIDSRSELWDGTPVEKPADLRNALLKRPEPLLRTFTRNLMAYALGRRVEYYDMPTIRAIVRNAEANQNRMSSYIMGVVQSPAFQMRSVGEVETVSANQ